jgi:hypothetical protein
VRARPRRAARGGVGGSASKQRRGCLWAQNRVVSRSCCSCRGSARWEVGCRCCLR